MKQEAGYFEGTEPHLIYIAKRLKDALGLENVLTEGEIDYGVETAEFQGGVIFRRARVGAFFYVRPEARERAEAVMRERGYAPVQ